MQSFRKQYLTHKQKGKKIINVFHIFKSAAHAPSQGPGFISIILQPKKWPWELIMCNNVWIHYFT